VSGPHRALQPFDIEALLCQAVDSALPFVRARGTSRKLPTFTRCFKALHSQGRPKLQLSLPEPSKVLFT